MKRTLYRVVLLAREGVDETAEVFLTEEEADVIRYAGDLLPGLVIEEAR